VERPSGGAIENLKRLLDPDEDIDVAFVQGGLGYGSDSAGLVSLGNVYYEPLWVFYRAPQPTDNLANLKGMRLAVGGEGSGTRKLALDLLEANGITGASAQILPQGGLEAVEALSAGKVDAIFLVGPVISGAVWTALYTDGFRLMSFSRADAYVRRYPFLSKLTLPRGTIDFVRDIPRRDVVLVAPVASLVAREDMHPALIDVLLDAANQVHSKPGVFQRAGEFPNAQGTDFPLSPDAERFYKSGWSFFHRHLPFWAASLVERTLVLLLPLIALAIPLARIVPALYGWRMRSGIYKWYGQLKFLEQAFESDPSSRSEAEWLSEVDQLEARVYRIRTPLAFANQLYILREHIALVRQRILSQKSGVVVSESTLKPG
jgi:TRAP-type uncharacterized transport system substrate-binding protein